ncbi:hypothetical protein SLA2020_313560 [Shorea laevis]
MVYFKTLCTSLALLLLLFTTFAAICPSTANGVNALSGENHGGKSHQMWKRKVRMNHGSFRGPHKHLVNPTLQHPFQVPKLPV